MNISILCTSAEHPVFNVLNDWQKKQNGRHKVELVQKKEQLSGGDILFLISCHEQIKSDVRKMYRVTLVVHASDLPKGRGWSPHIWNIIQGKNEMVVTLLEAEDNVDTGDVWHKVRVPLEGHELYDEINQKLFMAEISLMDYAVKNIDTLSPVKQVNAGATYFPRRVPEDSKLVPEKSIIAQFDLLRVADPVRYPSYFEHKGYKYKVTLEKIGEVSDS